MSEFMRRRIGTKPKHEDLLAKGRRIKSARTARRSAKRESFRRFYRRMYNHPGLRNMGRKQKRAILHEWWQDGKAES